MQAVSLHVQAAHLNDLNLAVNTNHVKATRHVQPEESGDLLDWQLVCPNKVQTAAVCLNPF